MITPARNQTVRWKKALLSSFGTTKVHLRNPYTIAWWSAAFPGFGHIFLGKYLRGLILFLWEIIINTQANINIAMIESFNGHILEAVDVLDKRWVLLYIPVYLFAIWDSYRTTIQLNIISKLSKIPNNSFVISPVDSNYIEKQSPFLAAIWSALIPGAGQLMNNRLLSSFFIFVWIGIIFFFSHFLEGVYYLFLGDISKATETFNKEWLLFLPSIYGFAIYEAYESTVENNKLFESEQVLFLRNNYQSFHKPEIFMKRSK